MQKRRSRLPLPGSRAEGDEAVVIALTIDSVRLLGLVVLVACVAWVAADLMRGRS